MPAIFIVAVVAFVINALVNEPMPTTITFALILAGVPVYSCFACRATLIFFGLRRFFLLILDAVLLLFCRGR